MTREAFLSHIFFAMFLFALSCCICLFLIKRVRIMDIPNERSSHKRPIPKSGGIVLVLTFTIGVVAIYLFGDATRIQTKYFFSFFISSLLIAAVSLYDDIHAKSFLFKFTGQIAAITCVMLFGITIAEITLPWVGPVQLGISGWVLTFLWMLGLTNAYNFMDGLNGMAAGPAVITALFFSYISFQAGSTFVYIICYTLISGALGFMVFNFPKPYLFMGDVGSAFLGFVFANLAIIAALYDHSHTSFFVIPLLLLNFIFDTSFTFIRRLIRGENVFAAHRTHLYQLLNQTGWSHVQVSLLHFSFCIAQGAGAVYMVHIQGNERVFVFLPYLLIQIIYATLVIQRARAAAVI